MSVKYEILKLETTEEIDGFVRLSESWFNLEPIAQLDLIQDWAGVLDELFSMVQAQAYGFPYEPKEICRSAILGKRKDGQVINASEKVAKRRKEAG